MVWCDGCEYWYHCDCLELEATEIDILANTVLNVQVHLHHMDLYHVFLPYLLLPFFGVRFLVLPLLVGLMMFMKRLPIGTRGQNRHSFCAGARLPFPIFCRLLSIGGVVMKAAVLMPILLILNHSLEMMLGCWRGA